MPQISRAPIPVPHPPNDNHRPWRRRIDPWLDPYMNGAYAAPLAAWGEASECMAAGIWIFVIIMVLFMVMLGGPRY